jgi:hypothetical protein
MMVASEVWSEQLPWLHASQDTSQVISDIVLSCYLHETNEDFLWTT